MLLYVKNAGLCIVEKRQESTNAAISIRENKMEQKTKTILIGSLIMMLCFIAGFMIRNNYIDCEQCIMGYHDTIVNGISQMARNCAPNNVEAFDAIDLKGVNWGVMLRCQNNTNISMSMRYYK